MKLEIVDIAEMAAAVDAAGPVRYLVAPLWPGDAYGVLGAEKKAGKTWADLDLAVSVALGGAWFGQYQVERQGSVVVFAGEGGARNIIRRLRAIAEHKDAKFGDLTGLIRISERVPRLTDPEAIAAVAEDLREHPDTVCAIIDPLYLAAGNAKLSDLYSMGEALTGVQVTVQEAEVALVVTTHWNKTGSGNGADRFTGAGPAEWGRVLGSAAVELRAPTADVDGGSEVTLRWEFSGSEIPEQEFRTVRRVWAEDTDDLMSPLHYSVEVTDEGSEFTTKEKLSASRRRVLAALEGSTEAKSVSTYDVQQKVASDKHGKPLKKRTVQDALGELKKIGLVRSNTYGNGEAALWWLPRAGWDALWDEYVGASSVTAEA